VKPQKPGIELSNAMSELNNQLSHFAQAIVHGEAPASQFNNCYANYSLSTAIEVYRNNYRGNLHDALAGAYPVIKQLVGDDFFRMLALRFIEHYPSKSANLHHYGAELSDFVARFEPAQELVYLSDTATLEWACHCAYFVDDEPLFDFGQLAQFTSEQHPYLVFNLHPATGMVRSPYPIVAIWLAHQPGAESDFHIDLNSGSCTALASRKLNEIEVINLLEAEAFWLQQILSGTLLGDATMKTLAHYPDFNLQATLIKLVDQRVFTGVKLQA
jgi:hypothetical protein